MGSTTIEVLRDGSASRKIIVGPAGRRGAMIQLLSILLLTCTVTGLAVALALTLRELRAVHATLASERHAHEITKDKLIRVATVNSGEMVQFSLGLITDSEAEHRAEQKRLFESSFVQSD